MFPVLLAYALVLLSVVSCLARIDHRDWPLCLELRRGTVIFQPQWHSIYRRRFAGSVRWRTDRNLFCDYADFQVSTRRAGALVSAATVPRSASAPVRGFSNEHLHDGAQLPLPPDGCNWEGNLRE